MRESEGEQVTTYKKERRKSTKDEERVIEF